MTHLSEQEMAEAKYEADERAYLAYIEEQADLALSAAESQADQS